jgi:hypothetical protein
MHLEPLTRAIETADFLAFREITARYLELRDYREPELSDGPHDGGTDFVVRAQGSNPTPLAIAATVQKADWKSKMLGDCRKAKTALGLTNVVCISSHRRPTGEVAGVAEELWANDGIQLRSIDSQAIASAFFAAGETGFVLRTLGITFGENRPAGVERPNLKEDAAYAFALFGEATESFRQSVVEQTVLSYLIDHNDGDERATVEAAVVTALQLGEDQVGLVSSAMDRMLQQQRLRAAGALMEASSDVRDDFELMRALRERQWKALEASVQQWLGNHPLYGSNLERATRAVMERAGALMMSSAAATSAAIGLSTDPAPIRGQLRKRLKELTTELTAAGVKESDIMSSVRELARLVSNSKIGSVLMAGELFVSLTAMQTNQFERAFGASGGSEIHLDASVGIPMITGLLYTPARRRFAESSMRVFELSETRSIPIFIPRIYLEEAAAHLLDAVDRYTPLLGLDDDLRFSTNAYVAHFSDLVKRGAVADDFMAYAKSLGYVSRSGSKERRVQAVAHELAPLFAQYGIRVSDLPPAREETLREAQEAVSFTMNDLGIRREGRLLEHDANVIARFLEADEGSDVVRIFCTWDKLHLRLHTPEGRARWQPLDPAMLGDVLILTRPEDDAELMTTVDIAMELDEEEGLRGAAVLDGLVRIEKENLHDAELLSLAQEFKDAYLQKLRDGATTEDLAEAWMAWKSGDRTLVGQSELPLSSGK